MPSLLNALRAIHAWVTLVRDPNRLGEVFALADNMMDEKVASEMSAFFARSETGRHALATMPRTGVISLEQLRKLPAGTLGHAFAKHLDANGLDPSALPTRPATDDASYMQAHLYETHDIWHAVTGFGADVAGELGLQAFYLAQFPAKLAMAILAGGILNTMFYKDHERDARFDEIARGWLLGRKAKPLFGIDWTSRWEQPLDELRRELDIDVDGVNRMLASLPRQALTADVFAQAA